MISRSAPVIIFTLAVGLALRIIPLPELFRFLNPDWSLLILIYWCIALPNRTGIGTAWFLGLFADVITGQLLGQQAFVYSLIIYGCLCFHQRLRLFPMPQQMLFILLFLFIAKLTNFRMISLHNQPPENIMYWVTPVIGMFFWPILFFVLRQFRRNYRLQ